MIRRFIRTVYFLLRALQAYNRAQRTDGFCSQHLYAK